MVRGLVEDLFDKEFGIHIEPDSFVIKGVNFNLKYGVNEKGYEAYLGKDVINEGSYVMLPNSILSVNGKNVPLFNVAIKCNYDHRSNTLTPTRSFIDQLGSYILEDNQKYCNEAVKQLPIHKAYSLMEILSEQKTDEEKVLSNLSNNKQYSIEE